MKKSFWPMVLAQFLGEYNDYFVRTSIMLYIAFLGKSGSLLNSAQIVMLTTVTLIAPFLLFSNLSGQLSDKYASNKLFKLLKISELIIIIMAVVGFYINSITMLFIAIFLMGTQTNFTIPLKYSMTNKLVDDSQSTHAMSIIESTHQLAVILGTLAGGIAVAFSIVPDSLGNEIFQPIYLCVAMLIIALTGLIASLYIEYVAPNDSKIKITYHLFRDNVTLLKFICVKTIVTKVCLYSAFFWSLNSVVSTILPVYVKHTLKANVTVANILYFVISIATMAGTFAVLYLKDEVRDKLKHIPACIFLITISTFLIGYLNYPASGIEKSPALAWCFSLTGLTVLLIFIILSFFSGILNVSLNNFVQKNIDSQYHARTFAAWNLLCTFCIFTGCLIVSITLQNTDTTAQHFGWFATIYLILHVITWIYFRFLHKKHDKSGLLHAL